MSLIQRQGLRARGRLVIDLSLVGMAREFQRTGERIDNRRGN